jgi:hypothetical protein
VKHTWKRASDINRGVTRSIAFACVQCECFRDWLSDSLFPQCKPKYLANVYALCRRAQSDCAIVLVLQRTAYSGSLLSQRKRGPFFLLRIYSSEIDFFVEIVTRTSFHFLYFCSTFLQTLLLFPLFLYSYNFSVCCLRR